MPPFRRAAPPPPSWCTPIPLRTAGADDAADDTAANDSAADVDRPAGTAGASVSVTAIPDEPAAAGAIEDSSTQSIAVVGGDKTAPADEAAPVTEAANPADDTSTTSLAIVESKTR